MAVDLIVRAARAPASNTCSLKALDSMEILSQTKRLEAALLEKGFDLSLLHLHVPEKGVAHLVGMVPTHEDKERIGQIIKSVPGVSIIRNELHVMTRAFA